MKPPQGDWTDAQIAMLTKLWTDGHSANTIAAKMYAETGFPFTRNAIVGKAHRLGLDGRPGPVNVTNARARRQRGDPMTPKERTQKYRANKAKPHKEPKQPLPVLVKAKPGDKLERMNGGAVSGAYTLEQAQALNGCRWPSGHRPKMTFCGARRNPHDPKDMYCEPHRSIASTPTARQAQER